MIHRIRRSFRLTGCISLIGAGEVVLLPLDVLKIKRQTNPEAFRGRGMGRIIADEGFGLYRGWQWTMARNFPGSFAVCCRSDTSLLCYANSTYSFLVARQPQNNTSSSWKTTTVLRGHKTSSLPSQGQVRQSSYQHRWMLSRRGSKHAILRIQRAACG